MIKYEWLDAYLEAFAAKGDQVDRIVAETMRGMR